MFEFKSNTQCFKDTVNTQQQFINIISIYTLLCFDSNFKTFCFTFELYYGIS